MKLTLRKSCYEGIAGKTKFIEKTEEHKKLVKEANERIFKGREKHAKAYENSKDYFN